MGRVRRNQRDAIRKQRAKRRNRQAGGETNDNCVETPVKKKRLLTEAQLPVPAHKTLSNSILLGTGETETSSQPFDDHSATIPAKVSAISDKSPQAKGPVDRIERMRLKKQQQKARNKEKKAARAAAASLKKDKKVI